MSKDPSNAAEQILQREFQLISAIHDARKAYGQYLLRVAKHFGFQPGQISGFGKEKFFIKSVDMLDVPPEGSSGYIGIRCTVQRNKADGTPAKVGEEHRTAWILVDKFPPFTDE